MSKDRAWLKAPSKKTWIILIAIMVIGLVVWLVLGKGLLNMGGGKSVDFKLLSKDDIPKTIENEVIPEYRELERALGCLIDGKVYVIVTRGEKPTSGYDVAIEKMTLEKSDGKSNLKVQAKFAEPEKGIAQSQVTTYPYAVASTNLTTLPDSIELVVKY